MPTSSTKLLLKPTHSKRPVPGSERENEYLKSAAKRLLSGPIRA